MLQRQEPVGVPAVGSAAAARMTIRMDPIGFVNRRGGRRPFWVRTRLGLEVLCLTEESFLQSSPVVWIRFVAIQQLSFSLLFYPMRVRLWFRCLSSDAPRMRQHLEKRLPAINQTGQGGGKAVGAGGG